MQPSPTLLLACGTVAGALAAYAALTYTEHKPQTTVRLDRDELEDAIRAVLAEADDSSVDQFGLQDDASTPAAHEQITRTRADSTAAIIQAAVETAAVSISNPPDSVAAQNAVDLAAAKREVRRERLRREQAEAQRADLGQQLRREEQLRRKIHEELMLLKGNIRVFCRVRPFLAAERKAGMGDATDLSSSNGQKQKLVLRQQDRNGTSRKHQFMFDRVLDAKVTQAELYSDVAQLCVSVIDGNRVCIFAYGQTGSGKTYTMEGKSTGGGGGGGSGGSEAKEDDEGEGIVYRAVRQLCHVTEERAMARARLRKGNSATNSKSTGASAGGWAIELSMYEVYNEAVCDLLQRAESQGSQGSAMSPSKASSPSKALKVQGGEACGLVSERCCSAQEVLRLLHQGHARRVTAATVLNASGSSRSHMVTALRVVLGGGGVEGEEAGDSNRGGERSDEEEKGYDNGEGEDDGKDEDDDDEEEGEDGGVEKGGCLHLIDLAGSERLAKALPPPSRGSSSMGGMAMGGPSAEEQAEHSSQQRQV
jgi:hypothetical protein